MRNAEKDALDMAKRRITILDEAFKLFSDNSIESVSMNAIADASKLGVATVYRLSLIHI